MSLCACGCGQDAGKYTKDHSHGKFVGKGTPKLFVKGHSGHKWKQKEQTGTLRHGQSTREARTPEYVAWCSMIQRCTNPKVHNYRDYGGRGIAVCNRWLSSFENFFADMRAKPTPAHTLERKNNNRGYCPSNCKWATRKEQANNRRPRR